MTNESGHNYYKWCVSMHTCMRERGCTYAHDRKETERQKDGEGKRECALCVQPSVKIWQWTIRLIHSYLVTVTLQPIK